MAPRLASLGLSTNLDSDVLDALHPCRSSRVLLLPQRPALWHPVPAHPTAGGASYSLLPLSPAECDLWRACNGTRTLAQAAQHAGMKASQARAFLLRWTHESVQALQLRPRPPRPGDPSLDRVLSRERPAQTRTPDQHGGSGETTLAAWHQRIDNPRQHFDDREITAAHVFALPHPALGGQAYGARLWQALHARGLLPGNGATVVEVGPGDGELGRDFYAAWPDRPQAVGRALRVDAAPALLALQAERQPHTEGLLGDASALPLADHSVDLLFSNEVLADLTAVPTAALDRPTAAAAEARGWIERYGLDPGPEEGFVNLGAWQFLKEVARVLRPGGAAWLSEFGALDEVPTETTHLDHPEVSVRFRPLVALAEQLGLQAETTRLDHFLGADLQARWLRRAHFDALRALWKAHGQRLAARAWTADTVPTPETVEGLSDAPLSQDGPGPVPTRFVCLLLRRPR